jgi:glycosyltransferase involved in cell wall biosynthesis
MGQHNSKKSPRLKIAFTHVRLGWGGSEKRVLWGLQALREKYDLTLITAGHFDLDALNSYYGTALKETDFNSVQVSLPFFMRDNSRMAAVRGALFQRYCQKVASNYDILISGYGPTDFGVPALHFIADFSWDQELREALHPYPRGWIYHKQWLRKIYIGIAAALRKPSGRNLFSGEDLMLSVSPWVSSVMRERYGIDSPVLPSPVPGNFKESRWENKQAGFVCLGRLAPEKRIEDVISILSAVRRRGHDVHLHIIGEGDNEVYVSSLRSLASNNKGWITLEGRKQGKEKEILLAEHAFGIHACRGDAFPGVLIEMMKAGCVVWAHDSGGQPDILETPALLYRDNNDAVERICRMLNDPEMLRVTHKRMKQLSKKYSVDSYIQNIRRIVEEWIYA